MGTSVSKWTLSVVQELVKVLQEVQPDVKCEMEEMDRMFYGDFIAQTHCLNV